MVRRVLAKLRAIPLMGDRSDRASIVLPFLIVAVGLGVLAWRSYLLSARMEHGVDTLAMQYAAYAADITAQRVDSAARNELFAAAEEWQQIERGSNASAALQKWLDSHDWIVFAIYIPDSDPTSSTFRTKREKKAGQPLITREFFT